MTERVLGPTGGRRRKRLAVFVPMLAIAALVLAIGASAGPISTTAGFQGDDANLVDDGAGIDWNSFAPVTWTGSTPFRQADKSDLGWQLKGLEDAQNDGSDSVFDGGVKQDANCAGEGPGPKPPNKDDLKRAYVASAVVGGKTYVALAWARIPQNSTSSSAHVGFEFNQGTTSCGSGSPLVHRSTANGGDLLIVYDFEGGSGAPVLKLLRWKTTGTCEQTGKAATAAGCWVFEQNLSQAGNAEARVNTTTAADEIHPGAPPSEGLATQEFGEAIVDLTGAGVFPSTATSCITLGKVYAVSRSSGNSGTAAMKDLVGPGEINISNCGTVTIVKHTVPADVNQNFGFTSTLAGAQMSCTPDTAPAAFTLNDSTGDTETCTNVPAGGYTVTEGANPLGFVFTDLSCSATGSGTSATPASGNATKVASITMAGGGAVTCTYTNTQQLGAIKITKTSKKSGNGLNGATFSITKDGTAITGSPFTTGTVGGSAGVICVDNLGFGDYVVTETAAPTGFAIDTSAGQTVTVDNSASCSDAVFGGESKGFTDTPLADIQVRFRDGGSGETALDGPATSNLTCDNATGTSNRDDTQGWDDTLTVSGIKVDGVAVITVTCTIKIDP